MPGSTPEEALDSFLKPLRRSLSCVTTETVLHPGGYDVGKEYVLLVRQGDAFKINGPLNLFLQIGFNYKIIHVSHGYKIKTIRYYYTLYQKADHKLKPILAYHWHENDNSENPVTFPHIHFYYHPQLGKCHFPTRRMTLERVLRTLLTDCEVKPLKSNWEKILDENQKAVETYWTWS